MQSTFALAMSSEGVVLYAHADEGWTVLGRATFSARNIGTQMAVLRRIAQSVEDRSDLPALLIVPEDQLLWKRFDPDGVPGDARAVNAFLADALDGLTPYDVKDLRFDWRRSGAGIDTAIVAKETLAEAERFANQHGFVPVGVAALAEGDAFPDTAYFGTLGHPFASNGKEQVAAPTAETIQSLPAAGIEAPPAAQDDLSPAQMAARLSTIDGETGPKDRPPAQAAPSRKAPLAIGLSMALVAGIAAALYFVPNTPSPSVAPQSAQAPSQAAPALPDYDTASPTPSSHLATRAQEANPESVAVMRAVLAFDMPSPDGVLSLDEPDDFRFVQPELIEIPSRDAFALHTQSDSALFLPPDPLESPPPQGSAFDVDENGVVRGTSDGTEAPGGYLVVSGQPPQQTAIRPVRNADTEGTTRLAASDDPLLQSPPKPRPSDLADRWERARFGGRTVAELQALRPAARPAEKAAKAAAQFAAAKPQFKVATAQTPRPQARPSNIATLANAYRSKQTQAAILSASSTAAVLNQPKKPATAPAPTPQTQSKTPEFSKNAPNTRPQNAPSNVASRATDINELNLSRVNLLGTFGKSGSMRALVRLPSGRVVNVSVGDRVDGGRVVAIGQGELRYAKGSRNVTLKMPRG